MRETPYSFEYQRVTISKIGQSAGKPEMEPSETTITPSF